MNWMAVSTKFSVEYTIGWVLRKRAKRMMVFHRKTKVYHKMMMGQVVRKIVMVS